MGKVVYYDHDGNRLDYLTQWDKNLTITIKGIPTYPAPTFHFASHGAKVAHVVSGDLNGNEFSVPIPNILLQQDKPIYLYVYYSYNDGTGKTEYTNVIPVIPRSKPSDYAYEENIDYISMVAVEAGINALYDQLSWYEF